VGLDGERLPVEELQFSEGHGTRHAYRPEQELALNSLPEDWRRPTKFSANRGNRLVRSARTPSSEPGRKLNRHSTTGLRGRWNSSGWDDQGRRQRYGAADRGNHSQAQTTFGGHVWLVEDGGGETLRV